MVAASLLQQLVTAGSDAGKGFAQLKASDLQQIWLHVIASAGPHICMQVVKSASLGFPRSLLGAVSALPCACSTSDGTPERLRQSAGL